MFAHGVHLADGGARLEQRLVHRLLVFEAHAFRGQREQRRAAAGDKTEHEVVLGQPLDQLEDALRRVAAGGVGNRVGGLDHFQALGRHAVAVAGHDQALERSLPGVLER